MLAPIDPTPLDWRPLTLADAGLLHGWLNVGEANRWYAHDRPKSMEEVLADIDPAKEPHVRKRIVTYGGTPIGYIQGYLHRDEAAYWGWLGMDDACGIDLFIGEPAFQHRGLGPALIRAFLKREYFTNPTIRGCVIDPDPANLAAIRAYEKTGFVHLVPNVDPPEFLRGAYLMRLERDRAG